MSRDLRPGKEFEGKPMPGDQYDPWVSFFKDGAFAALDVTAKGGLALFCSLRATWVTDEAYSVLVNSTLA